MGGSIGRVSEEIFLSIIHMDNRIKREHVTCTTRSTGSGSIQGDSGYLQMPKMTCHHGRRMPCALLSYPWTRRS